MTAAPRSHIGASRAPTGSAERAETAVLRAFPSMFAFCVGELRFSEGAAYNRILVARAARQIPAVIDAMRSGQVHLAGLRLLALLNSSRDKSAA